MGGDEGSSATLFDGTDITVVPLSEAESRLHMPELAASRGWVKATDDEFLLYQGIEQKRRAGKEPIIIFGPGVREALDEFTRSLRNHEGE